MTGMPASSLTSSRLASPTFQDQDDRQVRENRLIRHPFETPGVHHAIVPQRSRPRSSSDHHRLPGNDGDGQTPKQPKVAPGSERAGLGGRAEGSIRTLDVRRPAQPGEDDPEATPGLFRKAGPGPVTYTPVIALGLATRNRGGWYRRRRRRTLAAEEGALDLHVQEHDRGPEDRQEPAAAAGRGLEDGVRPGRRRRSASGSPTTD